MSIPDLQHLSVRSDYDLILLRQAVRQQAREAGLTAPRQARFTAAVSEYARLLLREETSATFAIGVVGVGDRAALEVACVLEAVGTGEIALQALSASPALMSARTLVDEVGIRSASDGPCLALRMRLAR